MLIAVDGSTAGPLVAFYDRWTSHGPILFPSPMQDHDLYNFVSSCNVTETIIQLVARDAMLCKRMIFQL